MAKINWTLEAERWLEKIHAYVAAHDPEAATVYTQKRVSKATVTVAVLEKP
ncbi:hypothetical protein HKB23_01100 [Vibrio parahaemolyticus]|nr:hypothetical protein [Vibrio parahaemolyticus]